MEEYLFLHTVYKILKKRDTSWCQWHRRVKISTLKGTVQRDFCPPVFFSFQLARATDQLVKIFSLSYSNVRVEKKLTYRSIMLRESEIFYPRTFLQKCKMYPVISRIRIHIYFGDTFPSKALAKVLRNGCWLSRVMTHRHCVRVVSDYANTVSS